MAWRSSGADNDGLVSNLQRFGVISSPAVEDGFRKVDRQLFVPKSFRSMAYADKPLRDGNVHISAPHIYGSVLEALELPKNSSLCFLNAGSGTGYLTCIAATILGHRSNHYCVEIHEDVVEHFKEAVSSWKEQMPAERNLHHIEVIHGNALEIVTDKGESVYGFDRIYIGAAIEASDLEHFKRLLKPGGILVGPVEDELVKVVRIKSEGPSATEGVGEYTHQILAGVHFAPLIANPSIPTVIPARVWTPLLHRYYPDRFRQSCKALLLCAHSTYQQPQPQQRVNAACMLPRVLWLEILSYTHRDWFAAPQSEVEFLRRRLKEEQANAESANLARLEAEKRCHLAEKERYIYKLLAARWKSRLNAAMGRSHNMAEIENVEEAAAAMLLGGRESLSLLGSRIMYGGLIGGHEDGDTLEDMDDTGVRGPNSDTDRMEDDEDEDEDSTEGMTGEEGDTVSMASVGPERPFSSSSNQFVNAAHSLSVRTKVRTVSNVGEDI